MLKKIISGSQSGVNRAALDVALDKNFPCGGWCPKGRLAEDGKLPSKYPIHEAKSSDDRIATELNITEGDGTLILSWGRSTGGTAMAQIITRRRGKPCLVIDLQLTYNYEKTSRAILDWVEDNKIEVLNITGPRESRCPGIYGDAKALLGKLIL